MARFGAIALTSCALIAFFQCAGCKEEPATDSTAPEAARSEVSLRIAVLDDEPLAAALELLRGEWSERTGGEFEVVRASHDLWSEAVEGADLAVFASRHLGALCENDWLRPMRESTLNDEELRFNDFFPLVREQEIVYGRQVMALPIGCPAPLLLTQVKSLGSPQMREPDDDQQLALALLAWAAPHTVHRSREATLFDHATMRPHLAAPPFERALELLAAGVVPKEDALTELVWPQRSRVAPEAPYLAVSQPPAAEEVFNPLAGEWEALSEQDAQATLLATSGRLLAVTRATRNAATAFRFAAWVAGPGNARRLAVASDHTANCRGSLARGADAWLASDDSDLAKQFATECADALRHTRFLTVPRIPGVDEYLDELGQQARRRLAGEATSSEALAAATAGWERITDGLGRDSQRRAYRRSLGVELYRP